MNSWIQHVKQVQREHGISYKDALKLASQTYNGGSIASEKVRRFIYKKGFDPAKLKNPSKFISDGKYKKTKKPKKNYKTYEELREHELQDLLAQDKTDKEYERLYRENKKLGGKIRGKGFLDTLKNIGSNAGKSFPINPFDLGYTIGHDVIAPELKKIK